MTKEAVVLFSGGTDSTLTAALMAEEFDKIHLITYDRFGIFQVENSKKNAQKLVDKFGKDKFVHKVINFDKVFQKVSYQNYLKNLIKFGFMNLSTCGLCKLSMHVMTIIYCLEFQIQRVSDGANKGMDVFPAQMDSVLDELRGMYEKFGIEYTNPVYEIDPPEEKSLIKDENMAFIHNNIYGAKSEEQKRTGGKTTGELLYDMGLSPEANVKGSRYDQKRQPRCFQFMLFSFYYNKWYLPIKGNSEYKKETTTFFKSKIQEISEVIELHRNGEVQKIFNIEES